MGSKGKGGKYVSAMIHIPREKNDEIMTCKRIKGVDFNEDYSKIKFIMTAIDGYIHEARYGFFMTLLDEDLKEKFIENTRDNRERKEILQAAMRAFVEKGRIMG